MFEGKQAVAVLIKVVHVEDCLFEVTTVNVTCFDVINRGIVKVLY